ncbi:UTP--glucose-1-phosphate uridylyltransferase [Dirofilaria immitis]|nr:UTP--glucose-1-phosphate uridylyltransferase [Dirofilaria immitis]
MNKCWDDEAQKLFKNVGEQFSQIFVNDERTQFDAEIFLSLFEQYLSEPNTVDWNRMKPLSLKFQQNYESLPKCSEKEERDEILKRVSVVKLNGGLGTTMGCNGPKSLIELRSGLTFLDFAIGHVRHFNEQNNSSVPLVLMNSFNTDKAVYEYLADRKINVKTFLQSKCPRIFVKNSMPVPLKDGGENIEGWYPPGHGNIFKSMHFTGVLDELLAQGRDICFISNIDNTGATIDLRIAKLMGGTLVEINGYIMHLEMPQGSVISYVCFHDRWILLGLGKVRRKDAITVVLSNGEFVNQLETSLGGAIRNFDKVLSIKVPRSRFLPVKNTQELLAIMSDLYEVTENFSLQFVRKDKAPIIELSEHFSKISEFRERFCEIPRLRELKRLKVEGNIYFEHDVILKDNVEIIADQGQKLKVAKGECLENIKLVQTAHSKKQLLLSVWSTIPHHKNTTCRYQQLRRKQLLPTTFVIVSCVVIDANKNYAMLFNTRKVLRYPVLLRTTAAAAGMPLLHRELAIIQELAILFILLANTVISKNLTNKLEDQNEQIGNTCNIIYAALFYHAGKRDNQE